MPPTNVARDNFVCNNGTTYDALLSAGIKPRQIFITDDDANNRHVWLMITLGLMNGEEPVYFNR